MGFMRVARAFRPVVITLSASALALSGCGSGPSYTVAADDVCAAERQQLNSFHDYFFQSMVQGAAAGALGGALMGGLIGGNAKGALIGAGAGAVVGGATGYFAAKQRAAGNPGQLTQSVYGDVSRENEQIDSVTLSFRRVSECRVRSAQSIKRDYAAGKMSQADAQARLGRIRGLYQEDISIAESLGAKMDERGREYQSASGELMKLDPSAQQTLAARQQAAASPPRPTPRPATAPAAAKPAAAAPATAPPPQDAAGVAQLTDTNQVKRKALNDDVAQAKVTASTAFELDGKISRIPEANEPVAQPI
jgi:hypothetical protein